MSPQHFLYLVSFLSALLCCSWTTYVVRRGRSFYARSEDGSEKLDIKLIRDLIIEALTVGGFVLLLGNFAFFITTKQWVFEPTLQDLSLLVVFIFSVLYVVEHAYDFAKEKAKKPRPIEAVREKA